MNHSILDPVSSPSPLSAHRWRWLAVLLVAAFMGVLDTSITINALPSIQANLRASDSQVQLFSAAYSLAYAVLLITGGRLGDLYGRQRLFRLGLSGFVLASALCGLAETPEVLIAARILQGLSAAVLFPQVTSFIQVLFTPQERGRAFALQGATVGLGIVAGPLLSGLLLGANVFGLDWRPIFLLNVPLGFAVWLAARSLPESRSTDLRRLDLPGVALLAVGLALLVYPLVQGREAGWPWWVMPSLSLSMLVLWRFVRLQRREERPVALLDLSLFRDATFSRGLFATFVFQTATVSFFLVSSLFLQRGLGFTPLHSALTLLPFQATAVVMSLASTRLAPQRALGVLRRGALLLASGFVLYILTVRLIPSASLGLALLPALVIGGAGFGMLVAPLNNVVLSGVVPSLTGMASGMLATVQQLGTALGVAVVGTLLFGQLAAHGPPTAASFGQAVQVALSYNVCAALVTFMALRLLTAVARRPNESSQASPEA